MPTSMKRGVPGGGSSSFNSGNDDDMVDIQPLRDLAKNFDIDIEPYLQEYLALTDQLDYTAAAGNGGNGNGSGEEGTARNFAAAALKIQNSVGIYNRKVDFLHQVTYEVFHDFIQTMISSRGGKSKNKKRSSSGVNRGDTDIEEFHEFDPEVEFLLLDDVLPTDRSEGRGKINLKEDRPRRSSSEGGVNLDDTLATTSVPGAGGGNNGGRTPDVTLLSLGGVMSATRMMDENNGTFVIHRQSLDGASPSAMSRMLMANLQGGNNGIGGNDNGGGGGEGSLRLLAGMCDLDHNGALLMPGTRASVFVNGEMAGSSNENEEIEIFPQGLSRNDDTNDFEAVDNASFHGGGDDDWGGDDDNGVGFELNDEQPMGIPADDEKNEEEDKSDAIVEDKPPSKPKAEEDPWAVLDMHEPSNDKIQPLRIGNTCRVPPEIDESDRPSVSVTGSSTRVKKKTTMKKKERAGVQPDLHSDYFYSRPFLAGITLDEEDDENEMDSSDATTKLETAPHMILFKSKGLIFGEEFAHVAKKHAKHREAIRKQRRMQQQQEQQEGKEKTGQNNIMNFDDENDDFGGGGGFDFGGGDDNDSFGDHDFGNPIDNEDNNQSIHRSNVDFNAIDDVFASAGGGGFDDNDFNEDGDFGNNGQQTFEELCRAHLRKFAKTAEIYAAETQLTKRVGAWQTGLAPLLEEQEKRPEFDIHSCGRRILEQVERNLTVRKRTSTGEKKLESSSSTSIGFSTIFPKDCEDYEVCRLFLSTLMLCNCGNVALHNDGVGDGEYAETLDSLDIELLDSTFQAPMEDFIAPSSADDDVRQEKENILSSNNLSTVGEN